MIFSLLDRETKGNTLRHHINVSVIVFALFFTLLGCHRAVREERLIEYIKDPDHGLIQEKAVNDVQIRVYYRPSDLLVSQELRARGEVSDSLIRKYRGEYGSNLYFAVSMMKNGGEVLSSYAGNQQEYGSMVQQLAFGLDQKVLLTSSAGDTLHLLNYVFPRTYGYAPTTDLLFVFEKKNLDSSEWISLKLEDFGLSTGDLRFKFYTRDLQRVPSLKFEKLQNHHE